MKILFAILPILVALAIGYMLGKMLPNRVNDKLIKSIAPLVWLMLFLIGFEFGEIIFSAEKIAQVVINALTFSTLTTSGSILLLLLLKEKKMKKK